MSEPANTFPADWELVPIKTLGEIKAGGTPSRTVPAFWNGSIPWVTPTEITALKGKYLRQTQERITQEGLQASAATLLPEGSLLITTRATIGGVAIAGKPVATNQGFKNIVPNESTHSDFYYYCLQTLVPEMHRRAIGSTFQEISKTEFEQILIQRPKKDEQSAIAGILDAADEAIQQTVAVIEKLKRIKAGLLHDLLTRGIDETGQLRDPTRYPDQFKDSHLGKVPRNWECCNLVQYMSFPTGQIDPKIKPYSDWPLIAPDHIESSTGRLLAMISAKDQGAISGKYEFQPGDVIYSKIRPYLRKAALATGYGLCSADMYPLRASERLDPLFLLMIILGEHFSRYAESVSARSGFPKINRKEIGGYRLALPHRDEQELAAGVYRSADQRILREEVTMAKLMKVKKGLMQDLLTGRVRVPMKRCEGNL